MKILKMLLIFYTVCRTNQAYSSFLKKQQYYRDSKSDEKQNMRGAQWKTSYLKNIEQINIKIWKDSRMRKMNVD